MYQLLYKFDLFLSLVAACRLRFTISRPLLLHYTKTYRLTVTTSAALLSSNVSPPSFRPSSSSFVSRKSLYKGCCFSLLLLFGRQKSSFGCYLSFSFSSHHHHHHHTRFGHSWFASRSFFHCFLLGCASIRSALRCFI